MSEWNYLVQLLYFRKLSRPKYTKILQEDAILTKNLYLSNGYDAWRLLSEFPDKGWKLGSVDSLLKRVHETDTIVWQRGSRRSHSVRSNNNIEKVEDLVLSQEDKQKTHGSSREILCETGIPCAQNNSPQSPAHMLQLTLCSAVVWSQPYHLQKMLLFFCKP